MIILTHSSNDPSYELGLNKLELYSIPVVKMLMLVSSQMNLLQKRLKNGNKKNLVSFKIIILKSCPLLLLGRTSYYSLLHRGLWCLMPLSTIFQLYHGSQFNVIISLRETSAFCIMEISVFHMHL
jgi:hypothetical protein